MVQNFVESVKKPINVNPKKPEFLIGFRLKKKYYKTEMPLNQM